ncbi:MULTISPECIES: FkbM family methyltransferase [Ponticoccus]|uniref:FkbM family methyltransferase n=1 Tax=Ponticoccus litoralis TaxID=422297 RepID=A0AAW9SAV6_9RHOB
MDFEHRISVNEHGFYCVPEAYAKREIPKILSQGAVYEPATLRLMARHARGGDIVTGGAFIGDFFPALSRALAPGCRVVSFEPNPLSRAAAERTIALNGLTNVDLHPVAVGEGPDRLNLQLSREGGSPSAARAKIVADPDAGETTPVEVVTLDSLVAPGRIVSVLHLDVEGHEKPALLGASRILSENRPLIVLEAERPWQRKMYAEFLAEHAPGAGYTFAGGMERNAFYLPTS